MNITEYAINKKLSGGGKRTGTAIKADADISQIFFNIANTVEETNAILSTLTFTPTPFLPYPIYIAYARTTDEAYGDFITVIDGGDGIYQIVNVKSIPDAWAETLYTGEEGAAEAYHGWMGCVTNWGSTMIHGGVHIADWRAPITDFGGFLPIGAENEKIKNVLSTTPF